MRRVLVPLDYHPSSENALAYASRHCREAGAMLYLLRVTEYPGDSSAGARDAASFRQESEWLKSKLPRAGQVPFEHHQRVGDPAATILSFAERYGVDLIVMGTQGRGSHGQYDLGSVAETVIRKAKCPVITIREPVSHALSQA